ncbi:unnamed protein product [Xyrichtys novacula]|uniref:Unnamed protein product n=1 Tax=Xyrichtys novacula TaxID=13765 RepID=A0AAV1EXC7_XYRNO|nr:unnamed protein product [Xyrichtys novacula]
MTPLTSPTGCQSCAKNQQENHRTQEHRIFNLYQIQDAEKQLDTILFGPATKSSSAGEMDNTTPYDPSPATAAPVLSSDQAPDVAATNCWLRLGAKPKALVSSTPTHPEPQLRRRGGNISLQRTDCPVIQLQNRYDIFNFDEFPALDGNSWRPPAPRESEKSRGASRSQASSSQPGGLDGRPSTSRSLPNFTPSSQGLSCGCSSGCSISPSMVKTLVPSAGITELPALSILSCGSPRCLTSKGSLH